MKNTHLPLKALFLDRDGIVNIDHGYVHDITDFEFTDGIFDLVTLFKDAGYTIFIVTNQSGIGRGYYSLQEFQALTAWMKAQFASQEIEITETFFCPHRPDEGCHCRKPKTGMIEACLEKYPVDLAHSWMIGDKQSDIDFASNAGIGHTIAIGNKDIKGAEYIFDSIMQCKRFLEENQGKIPL